MYFNGFSDQISFINLNNNWRDRLIRVVRLIPLIRVISHFKSERLTGDRAVKWAKDANGIQTSPVLAMTVQFCAVLFSHSPNRGQN